MLWKLFHPLHEPIRNDALLQRLEGKRIAVSQLRYSNSPCSQCRYQIGGLMSSSTHHKIRTKALTEKTAGCIRVMSQPVGGMVAVRD